MAREADALRTTIGQLELDREQQRTIEAGIDKLTGDAALALNEELQGALDSVSAHVAQGDAALVTQNAAAVRRVREIVVVGSKLREVVHRAGLRSDADLVEALSERVRELLDAAIARARARNSEAVAAADLPDVRDR